MGPTLLACQVLPHSCHCLHFPKLFLEDHLLTAPQANLFEFLPQQGLSRKLCPFPQANPLHGLPAPTHPTQGNPLLLHPTCSRLPLHRKISIFCVLRSKNTLQWYIYSVIDLIASDNIYIFFKKSTKTLRISHHNHLPLLKAYPILVVNCQVMAVRISLNYWSKPRLEGLEAENHSELGGNGENQKADFLTATVLSAPLQSMILEFPHISFFPHNLSTYSKISYIWMQCNWTREEKLRPNKFSLFTERKNSFSRPFWCTFLQCWVAILLLLRNRNLISRRILNNHNKFCVELPPRVTTNFRAAHFKAGSC